MPSYTFRRPWIYDRHKKRRVHPVLLAGSSNQYTINADAGSYTISGTDAFILIDRIVNADAGSYSISGTDAAILKDKIVSADPGSYAVAGTDAAILHDKIVAADPGSYAISGTDATILRDKVITADAGAVVIAGTDATILHDYIINADPGAFVISGTDAAILRDKVIAADAGAYIIGGIDASILRDKIIVADPGTYLINGTDADIIHSTPGAYVIDAGAGSFSISGTDAAILRDKQIVADAGLFTISGTNASIYRDKMIAANPGAFSILGTDLTILRDRIIVANPGTINISGTDATISTSSQNDYAALVQSTAAANLKGFWRLNESLGGTQAMDSSGNGNHSVALANNTFGISTGLGGSANTGSQFSGSVGSYIKLENEGAVGPLGATQFTITCWVKFLSSSFGATTSTGTGGIVMYPLVTKGQTEADSSPLNLNYALGVSSTKKLCGDFESTTGTNHPITGTTTLSENLWYFAALTYNGSSFKLFLNGAENATAISTSDTPQSNSIQPAAIGASFNSSGTAAGAVNAVIDEVAIWDTALSSAQILNLYETGSPTISLTAQINAIASLSGSVLVNRGLFDGEYFDVVSTRDKTFSIGTTRNKTFTLNADNSKSFNLKK